MPPTEQFPDQDPGTAGADTRKAGEPRNRGLRTAAHLALLLYLERRDLPGSEQQYLGVSGISAEFHPFARPLLVRSRRS
ncbi:hypothetical protein VOI32_35650 [Paraburkholderia caribensis]|uniref:Uncharacterized protein n=1 Tax=Paraburkholderia caribensis TaxID=75105 RepID=A0ABV0EAY5_9BURK|nr:hypothetical protein [Paraburkholderia caribensis]MCO4883444.1 hypothetical protein [Paraburkholderia caribensis]